MAFWGAPLYMPDHAMAACRAAICCQQRLAKLRDAWRGKGRPEFHARIGVNTGPVVVGNIGSEQRLNYTVIGDPVNVASRLESLNKQYGTTIILSDTTYRAAARWLIARPLDWVTVKGKKEGGLVYELLGLHGEMAGDQLPFVDGYRHALDAYQAQHWDKAALLFEQFLRHYPGDPPGEEMLRRCRRFRAEPPSAEWDGVFHMESK
jgi:adenylate cyclase